MLRHRRAIAARQRIDQGALASAGPSEQDEVDLPELRGSLPEWVEHCVGEVVGQGCLGLVNQLIHGVGLGT